MAVAAFVGWLAAAPTEMAGSPAPDRVDACVNGLVRTCSVLSSEHGLKPIQRTLKALEESTAKNPAVVRVLFYGQSIVGQQWHPLVMDELRRRYPTVIFEVENRAIGGFMSPSLKRTAESDLYPFYPDLVFFHVYGPMDKYEDIVRKIRETTTAEIVLWTSHLDGKDSETREKIEKAAAEPDERSCAIFDVANRYGCLAIDLRTKWSRMMLEKGFGPRDVLADGVHMKTSGPGFASYARFIAEGLRRLPGAGADTRYCGTIERIGIRDARISRKADGSLGFDFVGNRVVAVSDGTGEGECRILLDGRPPSEFPELYYTTRPSTIVSWMPMIKHVDIGADVRPQVEDWTLTYLEGTQPDGKAIRFRVDGSVTGFDGEGSNATDFRSVSGRAVIAKSDFHACWQYGYFLKGKSDDPRSARPGQKITWSTKALFADPFVAGAVGVRTTLVQNCANGRHRLMLVPSCGGRVGISHFIVYCPAIKQKTEGVKK